MVFFSLYLRSCILCFFLRIILTIFRGFSLHILETRSRKVERFRRQKRREMVLTVEKVPRWEWDYALTPTYDQFLFDEYLDIGKSAYDKYTGLTESWICLLFVNWQFIPWFWFLEWWLACWWSWHLFLRFPFVFFFWKGLRGRCARMIAPFPPLVQSFS